jgi:predicted ATPase
MQLTGLSPEDIHLMIADSLGVGSLPEPMIELIDEKAAGHPLYSEQLAYTLLDSGMITHSDGVLELASGIELQSEFISHSLHDAIMNRIDRLPEAPLLTLKVASVIGLTFSLELLEAVFPIEGERENLRQHLYLLEQMGFVEAQKSGGGSRFVFRDAYTQETAYEMLLFAQRRQLHRAIAEWYEQFYIEDLASHYPLLAHHWRWAEDMSRAIHYLEQAGEEAQRNGDLFGAQTFFSGALLLETESSVLSAGYTSYEDDQ